MGVGAVDKSGFYLVGEGWLRCVLTRWHDYSREMKLLIYTVAYDLPGWRGSRTMCKLLCSSLLRGFWSGEILVLRNFAQPLFPVERKGLEEGSHRAR